MKKLISILMAILLIAALCGSAYADSGVGVEPGQAMPDFTVALTDGTNATLSELLKEKELVVLNIFASWCGPCESEFPDMEKVYQAYGDRMVILSVSGYSDDTMEVISDYKAGHGLSFPMGLAGDALDFLNVSGYPTTIFVDRDGKVGFVKVGAFVTEGDFEARVKTFLSAEYDGKPLGSEIAFNTLPYIFGGILLIVLLLVIGRWGLFRKAGKPGWHSLIPFLSSYQEFALCWNGWVGVLAAACSLGAFVGAMMGLPEMAKSVLSAVSFVLGLVQSLKLAKAFGLGWFVGVLLSIPALHEIGRFILGVSKARSRNR